MRLTWKNTGTGYTAEGKEYSYSVEPAGHRWSVKKMRQQGGQVVKSAELVGMEGAFARAQTWEGQ